MLYYDTAILKKWEDNSHETRAKEHGVHQRQLTLQDGFKVRIVLM
jgi:hypothetical protein